MLSSNQQQQAGPVYEQVSAEKKLELRENVAYRPMQSIELRVNQAYAIGLGKPVNIVNL